MNLTELAQALADAEAPADRKTISRKIDTINSKLNDLDLDFTFNKKMAEQMLKQRIIDDKKKAKKSKRKKEKEQEALRKENPVDDQEGGDMMGSMWDLENGSSTTTPAEDQPLVRQRQMANPSWSG